MNLNHFYHYYKSKSGGVSNLLLGSEELDQSDQGEWVRYNMNGVDANVPGVANPLSSDETVEQLDFEASTVARIAQTVTLTAGTEYTFSVWARAASGTKPFRLRYWDSVGGSGGGSAFTASATWSPTTGRYEMTFTAQNSGTFQMFIQNAGGTAVSRRIYFWGAMLNVGASALDYVKTEFPAGPSNPPTPPMEFGDNFAGVTAYYSLRRFTTGEDNNAIRVRRSSDDTEQDIGFDANGDLDTTALLAFVGGQNLLLQSNQFDTTWVLQDVSVTSGQSGYDGSSDAWLLSVAGGTSGQRIEQLMTVSGTQTFSIYAKADTLNWVRLRGSSNTYFDLSNGTIGTDGHISSSIEGLGNGWYRCSIVTDTSSLVRIYLANSDGNVTQSSGSIYIQDAQLEEGSSATTYNPTTTSIAGDGAVTTWYDQSGNGNNATNSTESEQPLVVSGGTLVEENGKAAIDFDGVDDYLTSASLATTLSSIDFISAFTVFNGSSNNLTVWSVSDNTTTQVTRSMRNIIGQFDFQERDGSATRVTRGGSTTTQNLSSSLASIASGTNVYGNGTLADTDTTSLTSIALNSFNIGAYDRSTGLENFWDEPIQELIIFNSDQSSNRTSMETNINDHFDIYTP